MKTILKKKITIETYKKEFQQALIAGWTRVKQSSVIGVYEEAFNFFLKVGLYEGLFRPYIPNPVYDNAAKNVGEEFLAFALCKGISFKELFPGDFKISTESGLGDREYRYFYLTAFYNQKELGTFKISFEHCHDHFDFPTPPILEIENDAQCH